MLSTLCATPLFKKGKHKLSLRTNTQIASHLLYKDNDVFIKYKDKLLQGSVYYKIFVFHCETKSINMSKFLKQSH